MNYENPHNVNQSCHCPHAHPTHISIFASMCKSIHLMKKKMLFLIAIICLMKIDRKWEYEKEMDENYKQIFFRQTSKATEKKAACRKCFNQNFVCSNYSLFPLKYFCLFLFQAALKRKQKNYLAAFLLLPSAT